MQSLTLTNKQTNEVIVLDYSATPYLLQNIVGVSDAPVEILTTRGFQQDGTTDAGQFLAARVVSFSVVIFGDTLQEVYEHRRALIKTLNPKHTFEAIYQNDFTSKRINCRISGPPKFVSAQDGQAKREQTCIVSLHADNPFLLDVVDTTTQLAVITGAFSFPLSFEPTIIFSTLANRQITLYNNGDVETPVRIQFFGATTNPIVTNVTTGEFIKVMKVISSTEILEISTAYGQKTVEIIDGLGNRTNAFQYITDDTTFWSLEVGDNIITYDADSGAESSTVLIIHSDRYVGV